MLTRIVVAHRSTAAMLQDLALHAPNKRWSRIPLLVKRPRVIVIFESQVPPLDPYVYLLFCLAR